MTVLYQKYRSVAASFAVAIASVALAMILLVEPIPPRSVTIGNMQVMKRRLIIFAAFHNKLPATVDELPPLAGFVSDNVDGWGRKIIMIIDGDLVKLISRGRDGLIGGNGEDQDVQGEFLIKKSNGEWSDEMCSWTTLPFVDND